MRRLAIVVLVLLLAGQGGALVVRAYGLPGCARQAAQVVAESATLREAREAVRAIWEDVLGRWWSALAAWVHGLAAGISSWLNGPAKEALQALWAKIGDELARLWERLLGLWKWMDLGGGVKPVQ